MGNGYKSGGFESFIHQGLFVASFISGSRREVLSAMILCFHTRPEAGPRIDRLKFDRLADVLKLKR